MQEPSKRRADPTAQVSISLDGKKIRVSSKENLSSILLRTGSRVTGRSMKYHRPRGPMCGIGQCTGCIVRLNGVPMVRACQTYPRDGDVVELENGWPSTRHDMLGLFDRLYSDHMDTLHGFTSPMFLTTTYQRVIRKFSGLGAIPAPSTLSPQPVETVSIDILIIGGGLAGRSAEASVREAGMESRCILLDRDAGRGWSVAHLPQPSDGIFAALCTAPNHSARLVRSRAVLLATGAYDGNLVFPGHDVPGVITGDGALSLVSSDGSFPFANTILFGGGERALQLLHRLGRSIRAVVAPGGIGAELAELARGSGAVVKENYLISSARGRSALKELMIKPRAGGPEERLPADSLVFAHRLVPNSGLFFHAGAKMVWRHGGSALFPDTDPRGATSVPGLYAAGKAAGYLNSDDITESGTRAAKAAMEFAGLIPRVEEPPGWEGLIGHRVALEGEDPVLGYYKDLLKSTKLGKILVCPCEDATLGEIKAAIDAGWEPSLEVVKRITGAGMGLCQGRYCLPDIIELMAAMTSLSPEDIGYITQRPPLWPVTIGDLAGVRRT